MPVERPIKPQPINPPAQSGAHLVRRVEALLRAIEALQPGEIATLTITREASGFRWDGLPQRARAFPPKKV